jgi:plastocyanin
MSGVFALVLASCGTGNVNESSATSAASPAAGVTESSAAAGAAATPDPYGGSSSAPGTTSSEAPASGGAQSVDVTVEGFTFPAIEVTPGAIISLNNLDPEPHTVTADDDSFDSGPFSTDESAELTAPSLAGTYPFHCAVHSTMHGTLIVLEP